MSQEDDMRDLLALGGAISQQINASNSMRMEGDKAIPRIDPRKLMQDMSGRGSGNTTPMPPLPIGQSAVLNDIDFQGLNITPMQGLIPIDEALTDDMRKRGLTGRDFVNKVTTVIPEGKIAAPKTTIDTPQPVVDKNQLQFDFVDKLNNPKKQTQMEYFDEKFLLLDIKIDKILEKLNLILSKKKKI